MVIKNLKYLKVFVMGVCLFILSPKMNRVWAQSFSGTTWDITVQSISTKPYNFIFGDSGNKGNVLYPDGTLANFTWAEDGKGNWSITIERMVNGVQKTETFYGKITGNTGTGFYANTADKKNLKPLTMTKKK
jgi:nitrous oxidase accessory protein NosD